MDACGCGHSHDTEMERHHRDDAVCVDHVTFRYDGEAPALDQVTMHIPERTRLGVVGPNGGGKTTLLKILLGLLEPEEGSVTVFDRSPRRACRQSLVGYVPQRHEGELRFPVSVRQVVRMGLVGRAGVFRRLTVDQRDAADEAIAQVGLEKLATRPIGDLSGGQQQRAFLARALAPRPKLLILDEPTVGIDEVGQARFAELMNTVHSAYDLTLIIVSHDLRAIVAGCDQVACLNRRLHFHDAPSGLTRGVLSEVFEENVASMLSTGESGATS